VTIRLVISLEPALQALFNATWPVSRVENKLEQLSEAIGAIRMKLEDFQARIDQINANTTASAAAATAAAASAGNAATAAQTIKTTLEDLRAQIANAGLDATQEAALFASLDSAAAGTEAVKTAAAGIQTANVALAGFLEQVAAGPTEPSPVEPGPVEPAPNQSTVAVVD
jgi:ABC-type transporter Mla subunit MlaD